MSREKSPLRLYVEGFDAGEIIKSGELVKAFPEVKRSRIYRMIWVMQRDGWLEKSARGCVIRTGKVAT